MEPELESDAGDVNEFLLRIKELGDKRNREDEERVKNIEDEILAGRKARKAKREERARSLSPQKDTPTGTPSSSRTFKFDTPRIEETPTRTRIEEEGPVKENNDVEKEGSKDDARNDALDRLTATSSTPQATQEEPVPTEPAVTPARRAFPTPGSKPLSWQRRPQSMFMERTAFASTPTQFTRSSTLQEEAKVDDVEEPSRDEISKNLASKEPSFFRQTADRGVKSGALRRNAEESFLNSPKMMALPGMSANAATPEPTKPVTPLRSEGTPLSVGRSGLSSFTRDNTPTASTHSRTPSTPFDNVVRLEPKPFRPESHHSEEEEEVDDQDDVKSVVSSSTQSSVVPERGTGSSGRPASPTKGLGGFVTSAAFKRSGSIRRDNWGVTPPTTGLARAGSVAMDKSWVPPTRKEPHTSTLSRESTPAMDDEDDRANRGRAMSPSAASTMSVMSSEGDYHHSENRDSMLPISPSKTFNQRRWSPTKSSWLETALQKGADSPSFASTPIPTQPHFSPSKDANRSPTRERSFTRGDASPTRDNSVRREERARARLAGQSVPRKMSVTSQDSDDSRTGWNEQKGFKPIFPPKPSILSPKSIFDPPSLTPSVSSPNLTTLDRKEREDETEKKETTTKPPLAEKPASLVKSVSDTTGLEKPPVDLSSKPVFERGMPGSTIKDPLESRRARLQAAQEASSTTNGGGDLPFLNAMTRLKAAKTQNYRAPDELKETILQGKAGLAHSNGPQNYKAPNELKEKVLAAKSNLAASGGPQNYKAPNELKEKVLAAKSNLSRSNSPTKQMEPDPVKEGLVSLRGSLRQSASSPSINKGLSFKPSVPNKPSLAKNFFQPPELDSPNTSPTKMSNIEERSEPERSKSHDMDKNNYDSKPPPGPGKLQKSTSSLADRFNPNLVGLLSRGPPPAASGFNGPRIIGTSGNEDNVASDGKKPQLTHMTKDRARGPKRRAPATLASDNKFEMVEKGSIEQKRNDMPVKTQNPKPSQIADLPSLSPKVNKPATRETKSTPPVTPNKPSTFSMKATVEDDLPSPSNSEKIKPPTPAKSPLLVAKSSKLNSGDKPSDFSSPPPQTPAHKQQYTMEEDPASPTPLPLFSTPLQNRGTPRRLPTPPSVALLKENQRPLPILPLKPRAPVVEEVPDEEPPVSVKDAAGKWGSTNSTPETTPVRKGLNRLTSYQEEIAAMERSKSALSTMSPSQQRDGSSPFASPRQPPYNDTMPLSPSPQTSVLSDPNIFLAQFFNGSVSSPPRFSINIQRVIDARPVEQNIKSETLKKTMWEITGINGKKDLVSHGQEHVLYEDGLYLCLHAFMEDNGMMAYEVYMWSGEKVSSGTVEEAQLSARKLAREHDGRLIVLTQGRETPSFVAALGGVIITRRGSRASLRETAPYMLCCRRAFGGIALDEVDMHYSSLCAGFPYIISTPNKVYLWKGRGASEDEISTARKTATDFATSSIEEIAEGMETQEFNELIGGDAEEQAHADFWKLKPQYPQYTVRVFLVDQTSPAKIHELYPFCQSDLDSNNIYVVDAFFEMYIVLGANSQDKRIDFQHALQFTNEYSLLASSLEDRPFVPVSTVILGGAPREFKALFRRWQDSKMMTDWKPERRPSLRLMVGLTQAMELMRV